MYIVCVFHEYRRLRGGNAIILPQFASKQQTKRGNCPLSLPFSDDVDICPVSRWVLIAVLIAFVDPTQYSHSPTQHSHSHSHSHSQRLTNCLRDDAIREWCCVRV